MQLLGGVGDTPGGMVPKGQWSKLGEVPEAELKLIRENDPDRYRALYKAEYGVDCPKL